MLKRERHNRRLPRQHSPLAAKAILFGNPRPYFRCDAHVIAWHRFSPHESLRAKVPATSRKVRRRLRILACGLGTAVRCDTHVIAARRLAPHVTGLARLRSSRERVDRDAQPVWVANS